MSTRNGISFVDMRNINLKGHNGYGTGVINFDPANGLWAANPVLTTDYGLYINSAGSLVFSSLGTTTVLAGSGTGGPVPTWTQIYTGQATFTLTGTTWTIDNNTGNNDVLTLTNSGAGSGSVVQITNAGTGSDIKGTSGTWSVSKTGVAVFLSAQVTTNVIGSTGLTLSATGAGVVTVGANTNTITMAKATTFSSTVTVTDGLSAFGSTSNTAAALRVTNNTATTLGAGVADLGVAVIRSTSLTTGDLLHLQLTESALTTGNYIGCWDVTGGSIVFEVGKAGVVTIAGPSGGGSNALIVTAGDAILSDGSWAITDADNAASFTVTNNTATSASVAVFAGSGVFTGTTTTSWMTITPSGLTTGTAVYIAAAGATSSAGVVDIAVAGLTSGSALRITSATANFTTGGKLIELTSTAAVAGNLLTATTTGAYSGTGMILVTAGAATTGILVSIVSTTGLTSGSLLRATSSTAGAIATNGAVSITATGAYTSTSNVGFVSVQANTTTAGTVMNVSATSLTTGVGVYIANGTSAITTGSLVSVQASGTGTIATNGIVSIRHAGVFLSTSNAGVLDVQASALVGAGTVVNFASTAASQTAATVLNISSTGYTTGYTGSVVTMNSASTTGTGNILQITGVATTAGDAVKLINNAITLGAATILNLSHTTSVIGAGSSMVRITSTGVDTGSTTGTMLDIAATAATTAVLALITSATLTSGDAFKIVTAGATTGGGIVVQSPSSAAIAIGQNGKTNPAFAVDASTASSVSGILVKSGASGIAAAISVQSSATNDNLTIDAKGSGVINIGSTSTGIVTLSRGTLKSLVVGVTKTAAGSTQNVTPTAAQIIGGIYTHTSATGAGTNTLPTGTLISGAIAGVAVGDSFTHVYANIGNQTVTITTNTGLTLIGTAAVPTLKNAILTFVNTGSNTWDVYINLSA